MEQWLSNINVLDILNLKTIPEMLNSFLSTIGSFGAGFFSVIFISFFFLKDSKLFEQMILTMVPDNKESRVQNSMDTIKNLLSRYFYWITTSNFNTFHHLYDCIAHIWHSQCLYDSFIVRPTQFNPLRRTRYRIFPYDLFNHDQQPWQ